MKRLLYLGNKNKIATDNLNSYLLEDILSNSMEQGEVKRYFCKFNSLIIEYLDLSNVYVKEVINNFLSTLHIGDIVILNYSEEENLNIFRHMELNNDDIKCTFISGDKSLIEYIDSKIEKVYMPQLAPTNNESIDIESIFMFIINRNLYVDIKKKNIKNSTVILGYGYGENACGEILLKILREFKSMQKANIFNLNIYCENEISLNELTYIEDILCEYMIENSQLKIKQIMTRYLYGKIYFSLNVEK